jgi:glutathione peroxidase-family protein
MKYAKASVPETDLYWIFTKFIIDREGKRLARYEVGQDPADIGFQITIESALTGKLKKQVALKTDEPAGDEENNE